MLFKVSVNYKYSEKLCIFHGLFSIILLKFIRIIKNPKLYKLSTINNILRIFITNHQNNSF